jgi:glutamate-1-semialdehyde 2,1-aminomutase
MPIAAVGGGRAIMDAAARTWISSTLATEWASLAAARAVLEVFAVEPVVEHLAAQGRRLFEGLDGLAAAEPSRMVVRGIPQMCYLSFADPADGGAVARWAATQGLLFKRAAYNFVSYAHAESDVTRSLAIIAQALEATRPC